MKIACLRFMFLCATLVTGQLTADNIIKSAAAGMALENDLPYSVARTGDNYTFSFEPSPGDDATARLAAGLRVLRDVYQDDSIHNRHSKSYIRERARCYLFDSRFHSYTLCFLPNEFTRDKTDRLRGFVTQMPNWRWLLTHFFLPTGLFFGVLFYSRKQRLVS